MAKNGFLVWTNDEVELLLKVTQEYMEINMAENIDWESVQNKYSDILVKFRERYPSKEDAAASRKDYPHTPDEITRAQLTGKLKAIRGKYRQAVADGRKDRHGRVVLLYSELCGAIWNAMSRPLARSLPTGVESLDLVEGPVVVSVEGGVESGDGSTPVEDGVADAASSASAEVAEDRIPRTLSAPHRIEEAAREREWRRERLKRRLPLEIAQEDLELRRSLVKQVRQSDADFIQRLDDWSVTMRSVSSTMSNISSSLNRLVAHRARPTQPNVPTYQRQNDAVNGGGEAVPEVEVEIPDFSQDEESQEMKYKCKSGKEAHEEDDIAIFVKQLERKMRKLKDTRIVLQLQNQIEQSCFQALMSQTTTGNHQEMNSWF